MRASGVRLRTIGAIPCSGIKHRSTIINDLKRQFGKVRINICDDLVMYEVSEEKESNFLN